MFRLKPHLVCRLVAGRSLQLTSFSGAHLKTQGLKPPTAKPFPYPLLDQGAQDEIQ